jgi:hypothetical protein
VARPELIERYEALPMPTTADEHWRFTDLRGFDPAEFTADGAAEPAGVPEGMLDVDVAEDIRYLRPLALERPDLSATRHALESLGLLGQDLRPNGGMEA